MPCCAIPYQDESGELITGYVIAQEFTAWVSQEPVAKRDLERLGQTDVGIIMYRKLLRSLFSVAR